jgi:hypothetical protein
MTMDLKEIKQRLEYESPIEAHWHEMQIEFDNKVCKAVQKCDIHVDKDELIKALQYDREQYDRGYKQGYEDARTNFEQINDINRRQFDKACDELYQEHKKSYSMHDVCVLAEFVRELSEKLFGGAK